MREVAWLTRSEQWPNLRSLVLVESERTLRGQTSRERRAYISSLEASAERFSSLVRGHWHVENKLHWVLDVTFGEDRSRIARKNGAENLAVLRKVALNLLKNTQDGRKPTSLAGKKRRASWSFPYALRVLSAGITEG
jgi:predicted transposase YbfD/YdcC